MPRAWHDRHHALKVEDPRLRKLYLSILADRKPYFMRYIYPDLMKQYNTYIKNANKKAQREFSMSIGEMERRPDELREPEREFLKYYYRHMPVGVSDCVTNRICRRFEKAFDGYIGRHNAETDFDYTIMKSGAEYSRSQYNAVLRLFEDYGRRLRDYAIFISRERVDSDEAASYMSMMRDEFRSACDAACANAACLCDILLDICYQRSCTKRFAWDMCGKEIIENLLRRNGNRVSFLALSPDGEVSFGGDRFAMVEKEIGVAI